MSKFNIRYFTALFFADRILCATQCYGRAKVLNYQDPFLAHFTQKYTNILPFLKNDDGFRLYQAISLLEIEYKPEDR